jgi:HlyD family secretion protein/epimerase transport system membrane fusion protein
MPDSPSQIWSQLLQAFLSFGESYAGPLVAQVEAAVRSTGQPVEGVATAAAMTSMFVLAWLVRLVWKARRIRPRPGVKLSRVTRGPRALGYAAAIVLAAAFGAWGYGVKLASAAMAPGVVSPDGYRKTIQHLEGGIVRAIHVAEGDVVQSGDPLITLDDTQALARRQELLDRYIDLRAMEARLLAEKDGADEITVPADLTRMSIADYSRAIEDQADLFHSRRTSQAGREHILHQRIRQIEEQITGLGEMIAAEERQIALLERETEGAQKLYEDGLERLPRVLALQRDKAQVEVDRANNRARIAQNEQLIGETQMQLLALRDELAERVNEELTKVRSELAELRSQLASREDVLARTVIASPISGTVMHVRVTTVSGILKPGEPILEIVPQETKLIVDAQLRPVDIDTVFPGMQARVLLTAYRQRNLPQISGVLRSVSADILADERTGHPYYLAKVEVDRASLEEVGVQMLPGMPAEIMLLSGEQTLLDYIVSPMTESLNRSFRE